MPGVHLALGGPGVHVHVDGDAPQGYLRRGSLGEAGGADGVAWMGASPEECDAVE